MTRSSKVSTASGNTFKDAADACEETRGAYREGFKAMARADKERLAPPAKAALLGSIDMDKALRSRRPQESRLDYAIGLKLDGSTPAVVWLEIHPADTTNVREVIGKFEALIRWLRGPGAPFSQMREAKWWVATDGVRINRQKLLVLRQKGVRVRGHLHLDRAFDAA